jgi:protoheme IX farnesyltransferase
MIGWAAVTGGVSVESILMFAIIFMWTPPHFWALALFRAGDYERAGVPMLPVVAGEKETRRQIVIYSALLVPLGVVPAVIGLGGPAYAIASTVLGGIFLSLALSLWRADEEGERLQIARRLFGFSILYLFGLFAVLLVERLAAGLAS